MKRPIAPVVPQRASGAVVSITSNLWPITRDQGLVLFSYFPLSDVRKISEDLQRRDIGFVWSEDMDVVYTTESIELGGLVVGPRVEADLIDTLRLWKLVARSVQRAQLPVDFRPVVVEGSKSKLAIAVAPSWNEMTLSSIIDFFTSVCDHSVEKFNQHIFAQKGKRIRVRCSHYSHGRPSRCYNIAGMIPSSASEYRVEIRGQQMTIEEYFSQVHKLLLKNGELPLLVDDRGRVFPAELCQPVQPIHIEKNAFAELNLESVFRESFLVKKLEKFGVKIASFDGVKSRGRQLPLPPARFPLPINRAVNTVVFSYSEALNDALLRQLVSEAEQRTGAVLKLETVLKMSENEWEKDLKKIVANWSQRPDLVLVFLPGKLSDSVYNRIKYVLEFKLGLTSQFLLADRPIVTESYWHSLLGNLALKLGPVLPNLKPSGTVIAGIVTRSIESLRVKLIASTMSYDNGMNVFVPRVKAQAKKTDFDFNNIFYDLLMGYFGTCRNFPNRVIMYVKKPESGILFATVAGMLKGVHAAVSRINRELRTGINVKLGNGPDIKPNWTFIMCDNRTGVQISSESKQAVVASSGLVAPHGIEFLIQPAIPGARPVKYSLVHDANNFTVPEIENFTQQICAADASLPVSLVHAIKLLQRAESYILQDRELFRQKSPQDSADLINQKLFDSDELPSSYLATYI